MVDKFWLLDWMDAREARTVEDVARLLREDRTLDDLHELALRDLDSPNPQPTTTAPIVGGRALDLSGELVGANAEELIGQADDLFKRVWHYFDEVVVEGFASRRYVKMYEDSKYDLCNVRVLDHCELLMHLRSIGAIDKLVFTKKPDPCTRHGDDSHMLKEAGLSQIMARREAIVSDLAEGVLTGFLDHGDHFHYEYAHPFLGVRVGALSDHSMGPGCDDFSDERAVKRAIADEWFLYYAELTAADLYASRQVQAPLAVAEDLSERLVGVEAEARISSVALELGLPILQGVSARDIIRIREDESDSFERFRAALRKAIKDQVKANVDGEPISAATAIVDEILVPALHDIDQRLNVITRSFSKKSLVSASVATTAVTVGLLAGLPLLLPAGVALGVGIAGTHLAKLFEEKQAIELSDMYFLWKLQQRGSRR